MPRGLAALKHPEAIQNLRVRHKESLFASRLPIANRRTPGRANHPWRCYIKVPRSLGRDDQTGASIGKTAEIVSGQIDSAGRRTRRWYRYATEQEVLRGDYDAQII